ncbi:methyltransferase [Chloroflexi bacterium TSY]|nr:methyltransferase [Chloroflexi bacterium TSY]
MKSSDTQMMNDVHSIEEIAQHGSINAEEIESVLRQHPAVQEVLVQRRKKRDNDTWVAYVVRNPHDQSGRDPSLTDQLHNEKVTRWQVLFDHTYKRSADSENSAFDTASWQSSYTNQLISEDEMHEAVDDPIEHILALQPERVLEIGCGTGLLLFRIAPQCASYWGTDISPVVLESLQQRLERIDPPLSNVKLFHRSADDFADMAPNSIDIIVMNSVVQYFPSIHYLVQVVKDAVKRVKSGGAIFVGDVRSLPLLEAFHASVQLHHASASMETETLRQRIQMQIERENELAIDPAFFLALKQHLPEISHVEILPKRGRHHNELTKFRYQVLLHIGGQEVDSPCSVTKLDWKQEELTLPVLRRLLQEAEPELLYVTNVPNARLSVEIQLSTLLTSDEPPATVGELQKELDKAAEIGVDPCDLWALSDELPYRVEIRWAYHDQNGSYDLICQRTSSDTKLSHTKLSNSHFKINRAESSPDTEDDLGSWQGYASNPLQDRLNRRLGQQLRQFTKERLPDYMIPSAFVMVDVLPQRDL